MSNCSEAAKNTWNDGGTWPMQFASDGQYCLNRTPRGGVKAGESKCRWMRTHKLVNKDKDVHIWMWLDRTRHNRGFKGYWSRENETFSLQQSNYYPYKQICEWKSNLVPGIVLAKLITVQLSSSVPSAIAIQLLSNFQREQWVHLLMAPKQRGVIIGSAGIQPISIYQRNGREFVASELCDPYSFFFQRWVGLIWG